MKNYEEIKNRILENTDIEIDKREGSFVSNMVSPISLEISKFHENQDNLVDMAFIRNGKMNWLDLKAEEYGIYRKLGIKANGTCIIRGDDGIVIPQNSILYSDDLLFETIKDVTVSKIGADVQIEAIEEGSRYNLLINTELSLQEYINGIDSILVKSTFENGIDIETDVEFRDRYFNTISKNYTSGNVSHYEQWTGEVDGVGGCKVYPLKHGNGTVEIIIVNREMVSASTELIDKVKANLEGNRPIGANVTVVSAKEKVINVSANIKIASGYSLQTIKSDYDKMVTEYLKEISFKSSYVSVAKLGNLLLDIAGVFDYTDFKVNNTTSNINLSDGEVPKLGALSFTEV